MPEPLSGATLDAERKRAAEVRREAHERHVRYLEDNAWTWDGERWSLVDDDPRWSTQARLVVPAVDGYEQATESAWQIQKQREAEAKARSERR